MKNNPFWSLFITYRRDYITAIVFTLLGWLSTFAVPVIIKNLIDGIFPARPAEMSGVAGYFMALFGGKSYLAGHLWIAALSIIFFFSMNALFRHFTARYSGIACESILMELRNRLYANFQELPDSFFSKSPTGDLIQRCTSDIGKIQPFLSNQLLESGRQVVMLAVLIPLMFALDVKMALLSLFTVPFTIVMLYVYIRLLIRMSIDVEEKEGKLTTVIQENLTGIRVVRAFGRQDFEKDKFKQRSLDFHDAAINREKKFAAMFAWSSLLAFVQAGIVLITGIWLVANSRLSLGTLVVFISYSTSVVFTLRAFGLVLSGIGGSVVAISRIDEVLRHSERIDDQNKQKDFTLGGDVAFVNVGFSYNDKNRALKNVSFSIRSGETIAIVGPSGSGKSSLIKLLLRFYDCQEGMILLDGKNIKDLHPRTLRAQIGTSLQDTFLFSNTIKWNIKIAKENTADETMADAAKTASIHDTIQGFADGYDAFLGEKGVNLSGGQRQRLAGARTFVKTPPILMLDDAFSAVDTRTERAIIRAIDSKCKGTTTILVTHRLSCCIDADRILVLEDGNLVAQGTHTQLIEEEGFYQRLWEIQKGIEQEAFGGNANG